MPLPPKRATMAPMSPDELERIHAEIGKLIAEAAKLNAETAKMQRERAWYPVVLMTAAVGATAALAKLFLA